MQPAYRGLGVAWCEFIPAKGQSPRPPKSPATGDSLPTAPPTAATEIEAAEELPASAVGDPAAASHQRPVAPGDSAESASKRASGDSSLDAAGGSGDAQRASTNLCSVQPVTAAVTRRPLTREEIARALAYVECGLSLRAAAAELGRHHTTLLKRIKSERAVGDAFRAAQEKARSAPLAQIREASKTSWRAAAWLVKYLDARAQGGRAASVGNHVPKVTSTDIRCPKSSAERADEGEAGETGVDSELLSASDAT